MVRHEWLGTNTMNARVEPKLAEAASARKTPSPLIRRLGTFIQFEQDVRDADSLQALGFIVCNQMRSLLNYQTAVWTRSAGGQHQHAFAIAGVTSFDPEAPLVKFSDALVKQLRSNSSGSGPAATATTEPLDRQSLPKTLSASLDALGLPCLLRCELAAGQGTLILYRDMRWNVQEQQLLQQMAGVISHAASALTPPGLSATRLWSRLPSYKPLWLGLLLAAAAFIPVKQSVIAEGEIIASRPAVVTAAMDGIVKEIPVQPNDPVVKGQLLIRFDSNELDHKLERLQQEKAVAVEQLRKTQQATLASADQGQYLARLQADVDLKTLEIDYTIRQIDRLEIRAESDGIALYSRPKDWLGRSVQTGEKIMEVAVDSTHQFEAWVAVSDAIELNAGNEVRFFPDAFPLNDLSGAIEHVSYYARRNTHNDQLAYRVVADVTRSDPVARLGMKGAVRLYGEPVALGYYLLRGPLAATRQVLGI